MCCITVVPNCRPSETWWPESIKLFIDGQASSRSYDLAPRLSPSPLSQTQTKAEKERQLDVEKGGGGDRRGAESYDCEKAWYSKIIQYSLPMALWLSDYIRTVCWCLSLFPMCFIVPLRRSYRAPIQKTARAVIGMPIKTLFVNFVVQSAWTKVLLNS